MTSLGLANLITISRIILSFIFIGAFLAPGFTFKIVALIIFIIAALTDYWDGLAARILKQESAFGKMMDPLADKFLTLSAFLCFYLVDLISIWILAVIAVREIGVTLLRFFVVEKNKVAARPSGKKKTFIQLVVIILILMVLPIKETSYWDAGWNKPFQLSVDAMMILVVVLTLWSGFRFVTENAIKSKK